MSNTRVIEASTFTNRIHITIKESQQIQKEPFSSDFRVDNKDENSEPRPANNTPLTLATMLLNKVTGTDINPDHSVEQLCDPYIKSKLQKLSDTRK